MEQQYWTAVVVSNEKTFISDHFISFSPDEAYNQITATLPTGSRLVALVPGRHAINSFAYSAEERRSDWTRYVDPFEYGATNWRRKP